MSNQDVYDRARVYVDLDGIDWMGDGVSGQLITVEISDQTGITEPACCGLWPSEARELANSLLTAAEHADTLSRYPGSATP